MKKLIHLIEFIALGVWAYELYFLFTNGTDGHVDNIVIVMLLTILFAVRVFVKSAVGIVKIALAGVVVYAFINMVLPMLEM